MSTSILACFKPNSTDARVSKLKKGIKKSESKCPKKDNHKSVYRKRLLHFNGDVTDNFVIDERIVTCIQTIGKLTGMITVNSFPGTCFLQKIRRLKSEAGESTGRAVFTFTTVYHVFGVRDDEVYKLVSEWKELKVKVVLFYETVDDFYNGKRCPRLKDFRLLETDKEEEIQNDWCAIECEVDCGRVCEIDGDEKNMVDTLEAYLEDYKTQQKEIYDLIKNNTISTDNLVVIVGHPHGGPKHVSVGRHYPILKDEPKKVRSSQLWCRYYYDAPTCEGNSGSPVFIPGQPIAGFGFWFGHQHNHKSKVSWDPSDVQDAAKYEIARTVNPDIKFLGMSSIGVEQC
ncbi:uncharacterized protein LOC106056958 [Biomphalaria glabrata]|uniref:Uncharacterized protein LOC106056958 n=1 Tax=Biomphalaria glabrata TaxID=6526 RepID=A0A9U8E2M7_BIOGL|nr:uncharacterized protein LOC106056958 [Biomphalaria glabrata]XP_055862110.1 uncharacterized protein LOC106056958 [Biomphalaria glabrata]XP_055862111.1 uncharacterized protein LOC106056958 [Biomphalaria glabrata]XP_055862112.1 uncharacterized protein LOC106056958 [Biomphalaria glabrata]